MSKIQSMTGFGRGEIANSDYTVTVEIKSVNHRFKDLRFKMSSIFSSVEIELKKLLTDKFKRGSFDIFINYKRGEDKSKFDEIDNKKIAAFLEQMKGISEASGVPLQIRPCDFLRSEFYMEQDQNKHDDLKAYVVDAFKLALDDLEKSRLSEGEKLLKVLLKHKEQYDSYYSKIEGLSDQYQQGVEEKLKKRFEENKEMVGVDEPRFMQEVIYYLEKLDVHEEINRIAAHLQKLDDLLKKESEVGRQIDFLVQEFNRETNTIGSKSGLKDISDCVVQMKVQLEKIREQALNIE